MYLVCSKSFGTFETARQLDVLVMSGKLCYLVACFLIILFFFCRVILLRLVMALELFVHVRVEYVLRYLRWPIFVSMKDMLTVFWHRVCCASWIFTSGAKSKSLVLSQSAEISKRKCQEKKTSVVEKLLLTPPSWQCAGSCIATDSWLFGQHEYNCSSSVTLLTWPGSSRLFLVSQTEITNQKKIIFILVLFVNSEHYPGINIQ
jgi:hypothetical protein